MLCCDCSEWMRNGDLMPTRFESQKDALGVISNAKTEQNQENTIDLISMGGNGKADVLVNCTNDVGRVLAAADKMKIDGKADILVALQTSQLALKHRKNKKQDQRIILFVGSPVDCSEKLLIKAGKRLKKNNVAVDVINFGEVEQNATILDAFLNAVNSNDNSHLVTVPTTGLISEAIISSAIFSQQGVINEFAGLGDGNADGGGAGVNIGGGANDMMGGVDANLDPELAMAIRMSLEAERQRREVEAKQATDESLQTAAQQQQQQQQQQPQPQQQQQQQPQPQQREPMDIVNADDNKNNDDADADANANVNAEDDADDAELLEAMKMSMMAEDNKDDVSDEIMADSKGKKSSSANIDSMLNDESFMDELLSNLPGISKEDININDLLKINNQDDDKDKDKDKKKDDKDKDKKDKKDEQ